MRKVRVFVAICFVYLPTDCTHGIVSYIIGGELISFTQRHWNMEYKSCKTSSSGLNECLCDFYNGYENVALRITDKK